MKNEFRHLIGLSLAIVILTASGCAFMGKRVTTSPNYYILDYLPATENPALKQIQPFDKLLEVRETSLPRTYDRNQIVRKKSYMQISYLTNDLWSTKLYDAVPNLIVRRLNAYRIFRNVSRDLGVARPDYYLETYIQNIELVEGPKPYAFLRMEFSLRDSKTQTLIFTNRNERTKVLHDSSISYLVQSFNEMIMAETDLFAAKCIDFLQGQQVTDSFDTIPLEERKMAVYSEEFIEPGGVIDMESGELRVPLLMSSEVPLPFEAAYLGSDDIRDDVVTGTMNELLVLHKGSWEIALGSDQDISTVVDIKPQMRQVISPFWSELIVRIIDESQTQVRMRYDIYAKTYGQETFDIKVNTRYSPGDEVGEFEYLWVLKPGNYMVTVNGAVPNAYRDFTTVSLEEGKSYILTIVVNPTGERSVLVGAGILESSVLRGRPRLHKGAVHTNINFASNNSVDKNNPTSSISLSGEFDNKINYDIWPLHFTAKSLYNLGFDKTTGTDFRINIDDYSLKNVLVFYPWNVQKTLRNFGLYARANINTHFFDEYSFFQDEKNFLKTSQDGDSVFVLAAKKLKVKDSFYPLRLKEGLGVTYRMNLATNMIVNLRSGFGWLQDKEDGVYSYVGDVEVDSVLYDLYHETPSSDTQGLETTVLVNITNLLNFLNISSNLDVLFPMGVTDKSTKYEFENLLNIKLFRNISIDFKANIKYNKVLRDYIQTDYSAFLRLSLYY